MGPKKGYRLIAEFSIHPVGMGTSVSRYVKVALSELRKAKGVRLMVTPMATVIEAEELPEIFRAVEMAHEAMFKEGAMRVDFILRVDDRRDKKRRMEDKILAVS